MIFFGNTEFHVGDIFFDTHFTRLISNVVLRRILNNKTNILYFENQQHV